MRCRVAVRPRRASRAHARGAVAEWTVRLGPTPEETIGPASDADDDRRVRRRRCSSVRTKASGPPAETTAGGPVPKRESVQTPWRALTSETPGLLSRVQVVSIWNVASLETEYLWTNARSTIEYASSRSPRSGRCA